MVGRNRRVSKHYERPPETAGKVARLRGDDAPDGDEPGGETIGPLVSLPRRVIRPRPCTNAKKTRCYPYSGSHNDRSIA